MPRPEGGPPPALPIEFISGVSDVSDLEVANWTTDDMSPNPSGSNRFILGWSGPCNGSAPAPTTSAFKFGGSGGTDMAPFGAQQLFFFNGGALSLYTYVPGPNGIPTNVYGAWPPTALEATLGGLCYANVDQVTSAQGYATNAGATSETEFVMNVEIPGCVANQRAVAVFALGNLSLTPGSFTEVSGFPIRGNPSTGLLTWSVAVDHAVTVDGTVDAQITVNNPAGSFISWRGIGLQLNQAT